MEILYEVEKRILSAKYCNSEFPFPIILLKFRVFSSKIESIPGFNDSHDPCEFNWNKITLSKSLDCSCFY